MLVRKPLPTQEDRGDGNSASAAAVRSILDRMRLPVVLLRPDRFVLLANIALLQLEARGYCIRILANKLTLVEPRNQRILEAFLRDGSSANRQGAIHLCVSHRACVDCGHFLILEWLDCPNGSRDRVAMLVVHEECQAGQPDTELLVNIYGLTRMQAQLVAALFVAPALRAAAARCDVSLNTAKTHLKQVFAKCGVHSKAELFRLLTPGLATRLAVPATRI